MEADECEKKKNLSKPNFSCTLLCGSLLFPVKAEATYDWSKPRPSTGTIYNETIGKSATDGIAEVDMGIHIYQYIEGVSDEHDFIHFKVSASANARMGIQYDVYEEDYNYQWLEVSEPTGITSDDGGVEIELGLPFGFLYYGVVYESIWVCSNGFVTLNKTATNADPKRYQAPMSPTLSLRFSGETCIQNGEAQ